MVKEQHLEEANRLFSDLEVEVSLAGRFLGGYVGKEEGVHEHVRLKVELWVKAVGHLASAARAYPQSAYAAFTRSLSCEWTYLQRVVGGCDDEYIPLREVIQRVFTPAVLGREVLQREHELFGLSVRNGGLALVDPVSTAGTAFRVSKAATAVLQEAVKSGDPVNMTDHDACRRSVTRNWQKERSSLEATHLDQLLLEMPAGPRRTLKRITKGQASGWLSTLLLKSDGFDLSARHTVQGPAGYSLPPRASRSTCSVRWLRSSFLPPTWP